MKRETKKLVLMGMLVALAYISLWCVRIPIIPAASFLRYDVKDVFICIGGLVCGPIYCFGAAICISVLQMFTVSEYGFIGLVMNIFSVLSYSGLISLLCRRNKSKINLVFSLCAGIVSMTIVMILWNYLITPLYMGVSREAVLKMIMPILLPFNLIKSVLNSILVFVLYITLGNTIRKFKG